jgi:hypothetical protein
MARHNDTVDPYSVLGVRPDSSEQQVAAAYKELAKRWHPDRGAGEEGERKMAEINVAYDVLRATDSHGLPTATRAAPAPPRGHGWWLPVWIRRALGIELLQALTEGEEVRMVTPVSLSASPRAVLVVTERRLLWLLDDAPVGRVRSVGFRDVAAIESRSKRRGASLTVRTLSGRRHTFHGLRPHTAATIANHVRPV